MIPVQTWNSVDEKTQEQVDNLASLPFAHHHIALMPDAHVGYGMPIGGVLAAQDAVIPNAVGVDIGCGVLSVATDISKRDFLPHRETILDNILKSVPVGFSRHTQRQFSIPEMPDLEILTGNTVVAELSMGTLGGGNHFIEIQYDEDERIYIMIHSGSRNLGKQVCDYYNLVARCLNSRWFSSVPRDWELAFLPLDTPEADEYLAAMNYCVDYAAKNRACMAHLVEGIFEPIFGSTAEWGVGLDTLHNYAASERHYGRQVVVHRKGAVRASGPLNIPGSMGSHSFIGRGLATHYSFNSCSHGAGRAMGRNEAKRTLSHDDVVREMIGCDILIRTPHPRDIVSESRQAYKDIDDVMDKQRDLVEVQKRLTPLGVVKG